MMGLVCNLSTQEPKANVGYLDTYNPFLKTNSCGSKDTTYVEGARMREEGLR